MKPAFKILPFYFFACLILVACSKNADAPATSVNATNNSVAKITSGNWVISSYTQRTEDKTSMFEGVVFTFSDAGKMTATQNGSVIVGTWSYSPSSVVYYGSAPTKESITINMGAAKPSKNLNRIWNVVSSDGSALSLVNPEPADDEHIVFSKQ